MPVNTINHVSVRALDLEESVAFYVELLGPENCEPIPTPDFGFPVPVQWLRIGDREIHIFQLEIPAPARQHHFGIGARSAEQFERIYSMAKERGILDSESFGHHVYEMPGGCAQLYVIDPAGNLVEIDWHEAAEIDEQVVTDMKRIADRGPQSEDSLRSSLFLEKLQSRGWKPSGDL
ncbi:MAG: VOC family protein [Actinobacteria bacterium]|nr:VOC family protein [Actinomycetota bacterium]